MGDPIVKREEFTEAERSILVEALAHWRRKFTGRMGHAKLAQKNIESSARYHEEVERRNGLKPMLGETCRQYLPEWQEKEEANRAQAALTKGLLDRLKAPCDPTEYSVSDEIKEWVKAGRPALLKDGEEVWGILAPAWWSDLVTRVMGELKGWNGQWTVIKLPPGEEDNHADPT
jgi:hypothetical protein